MIFYNDITIPDLIRTDRIISAFVNITDNRKATEYADIMTVEDLNHEFPPIIGFPTIIDEDDVENEVTFMNGEIVCPEHIGQLAWMVTDGHHRTLAAIQAELPHLEVEMDESCFVNEAELKAYREHNTRNHENRD